MLLVPYKVTRGCNPSSRDRGNLLWEPRVPDRLLNGVLRRDSFWIGTEELSIGIDRACEGVREPIQSHTVQDLIEIWFLVGPLQELLANPGYHACQLSAVNSERSRCATNHINNANGDVESNNPIVAGRCPCSRAYASPWVPNPAALPRPSSSRALMLSCETFSGGGIKAKLT